MAASNPPASPGPAVHAGSRVVIVVSRGPAPGPRHSAAPVPALIGLPQGDALEHLQAVALNAQVFNDFSDTVKRGHIVDQFPPAGASAPVNSEVAVLVSSGPGEKTSPVALPDVVGLHEAVASAALSSAGLEPEVARDYHPNVEEGVVIAQLPSQSTISATKRHGSLAWLWIVIAVLLVLAAAAAAYFLLAGRQVSAPNVTGQPLAQAEQALTSAGLKTGNVSSRVGSSAAAGIVLEQSPKGGVEIDTGSPVDLVVAGTIPVATVPNLVGLNSSDARSAVQAAGFVEQISRLYSDTVPKDAVISQTPAAGSTAPKGTTVIVSLSLGSKIIDVTLPDFVGMTRNTAVNRAVSVGLQARVSEQFDGTAPAGQVVDQIPDAGQTVAPGTTIGISVSLGPPPSTAVTVPDLKGQTQANAQDALSALGLVSAVVSWDGTGQPADTVVGVLPNAGQQLATGNTVVIFVSSGR